MDQADRVDQADQPPSATADESRRPTRPPRAWDDAPLRNKLALLVMGAVVGGGLIGMAEARLGYPIWLFAGASTGLTFLLLILGAHWIALPWERFVTRAKALNENSRPRGLGVLPLHRRDELGDMARIFHQLAIRSIRDHYDARQLRRTMDARVTREIRKATAQLQRMVNRDPLTDLGNRRFLDHNLEALFEAARSADEDLVVLAIDMDGFKQVNDTFGHAVGDDLIISLATLLRGCVRDEDWAIRLGGDEFVVLMPGASKSRAHDLSRQIACLFNQHLSLALPGHRGTGLSIGIASRVDDRPGSGRELLERADEHLYAAKKAGKGRAVSSAPSASSGSRRSA